MKNIKFTVDMIKMSNEPCNPKQCNDTILNYYTVQTHDICHSDKFPPFGTIIRVDGPRN